MISIRVKADRDPSVLADLIESATQTAEGSGTMPTPDDELLRALIAQQVTEPPPHDQIETVDFQRLDTENDWTDV